METPRHLRQKILHGTFALFPLMDTCWNQFGYIVSTFSPCGLDLATLFLVPSRMESCKKRCFRHLPFRENTIIMPQILLSVLLGRKDVVSIPMHNGFAILSVVSCHFYAVRPSKRCFSKISVRKWHILICFCTFAEHSQLKRLQT